MDAGYMKIVIESFGITSNALFCLTTDHFRMSSSLAAFRMHEKHLRRLCTSNHVAQRFLAALQCGFTDRP